jgi:alkanesulfonate monooxygenase SsuD/methylene tetrahydromethanopterin reductase-like flavin-dependent oxidoreductase (luciferase family)
MRPVVAFYAGFFPRYARLVAESGFPEAAREIREAWRRGERERAARAVPDEVVSALAVVGGASECRERADAYRDSGIRLPIIFPLSTGPDAKESVMAAIRALAP